MNPEKAGAVEIANARNFLDWTHVQHWMVLHELAHAYHDQVLGFENPEIHACYEHAVQAKLYDAVLHWDGKTVRAYARTNEREYFAECTEAFFGENDFYPFVRAELRQHDPGMYRLLQKVWREKSG
jgi:Mlc titration factor MtfA (ptsG expression regulator)